jgi:hypothetical protein
MGCFVLDEPPHYFFGKWWPEAVCSVGEEAPCYWGIAAINVRRACVVVAVRLVLVLPCFDGIYEGNG